MKSNINPSTDKWPTHNDAVLLVSLQADGSDITDIGAAERAEEAGLTVLMAGEQLPVRHHQATRDTWSGGQTLRDDLQAQRLFIERHRDCAPLWTPTAVVAVEPGSEIHEGKGQNCP